MAEETNQPKAPISIDFTDFYKSTVDSGKQFNPAIVAQAYSQIKKEDPAATLNFSDEKYKELKDSIGEEEAKKVKKAYIDTVELNEISDKQDLFAPVALAGYQNDLEGIKNFSSLARNEVKIDPVFRNNSFYKPAQYRTFQEAAESNLNYFDSDGTVKKLKDSEDFSDIANPWMIGFGGNSLVVSTNEFVAETNPEVKAMIDEGILNPKGFYKDDTGNFMYRKLKEGEENFDNVRSIFGPRSIYNSGLLKESAESFYDGVLGLVEGAGTLAYYGNKLTSMPLRILGFRAFDDANNNYFNDFVNMTSRMKSAGSMEEDRGVLDNWTNFTKAVMNGVGQIVGTMGAGYAVGGIMKGVGAMNKANQVGKLSNLYAADFASATTRALNFGIAAKAGKEESMKAGLSKDESDLMGLISGSIMLGTEYLTGSQFIPKMAGKAGYADTTRKVTQYFIKEAEKQGLKVGEVLAKNPKQFKEMIFKAHKWLEGSASTRTSAFIKGFTGEALQETSEDFGFSLTKEGYDLISGSKSFDQDWKEVAHDLLGSFLVGGFSGGLTRFATHKKSDAEKDAVDDQRNNFIVNEIASGNGENLLKAIDDAFIKDELGSKVLSANRDEDGNKMLASKDKGLDAKTENEFFRDVFKSQVAFAMQVHADLQGKVASKQEMADTMFELMGQKAFDGELGMDELVKGISQAIEIEAMQIFRKESITKGKMALSMAKKKAVSSSSLIHTLTDLRMVNDRVVAVKRSGETEFSNPSVEERAAIEMAYRDFNTNTSSGFKSKFDVISQQLTKAIIAKNILEANVSRFTDNVKIAEFGLKKTAEYEEAVKEVEQISDDFQKLMEDEGYSPDLIESAVELQFMEQFKEKLTNGERAIRYGKNYRINMQKKKFLEIFKNKPDYNIEDFESEKNGYQYFAETSSDLITETNEVSDSYTAQIKDFLAIGDTVSILQITKIALENNIQFSEESITELNDYFKQFNESFTTEVSEQYADDLKLFAGIIKYIAEGQLNSGTIAIQGIEALGNLVEPEEVDGLMKTLTEEDLVSALNSIDKSVIGGESEFTQAEFDNILNNLVPRYYSMKSKFDLLGQTNALINQMNAKKIVVGRLSAIDAVEGFLQNQNLKMNYNYSASDSIGAVLNAKEKEHEDDPKGFVDNGTLNSLITEIRKNQRFIIARIVELTNKDADSEELVDGEVKKLEDGMNLLMYQLEAIEKLQEASNRNRGNRFKRDYEVKNQYIANATSILSEIDKLLEIGDNAEIISLDKGLDITDENKAIIDQDFETLIDLEEKFSEIIANLSDEQASDLIQRMIIKDGPKDLTAYLFKSYNEDQKNPFNPDNDRDNLEGKFNYLTMLSRGNIRDYFTFTNEYIKARELRDEFIPSQEQILIAKHVFSILNSGKPNSIERQFQKAIDDTGVIYDRNIVFARGIAGAGKSTMVVNLAFEAWALRNRAINDTVTSVAYTAPIDAQITTIQESFEKIKGENIVSNSFKIGTLEEVETGDYLKGKDAIVVDEATVFNLDLQKLIKKVNEINEKRIVPLKIILIGDELQKSGNLPEPYIYGYGNKIVFERTVPLTTPYRSGKVDSFDVNGNHREVIAELAKMYVYTKRKTPYRTPFGTEVILEGLPDAERISIVRALINSVIKAKTTTYFEKDGAIEYGVRAYSSASEVNEKFVKDYIAKENKEGMVMITDNYEFTINELKSLFAALGFDITDSMVELMVKKSQDTQGLTFDHVYTNIEIGEHEFATDYMRDFQSLYVAESREKKSLVLVSPMGTIDSKKVLNQDTIPAFAELNLKERDGEELKGDSLELFNNNSHIAEVIERLAGEIPSRVGTKVETSKIIVGETEVYEDKSEEETDIDKKVTEPNPKEEMTDKEKEEAEEAIIKNQEQEKEILDELSKKTIWEAANDESIDVMDMFKGCSI